MTCSTSFSSKIAWLLVYLLVALLGGCATRDAASKSDLSGGENKEQAIEVNLPENIDRVNEGILIAVLPFENLSSTRAPLKEMAAAYRASLKEKGFNIIDSDLLEQFRKKHRMRYTGGVSSVIAEALQEEMKVDAILITSLEAYNERKPTQISLISRLVTSGRQPEIEWFDSVGLSGDQSPGLLDLTLINEPQPLLAKAVGDLVSSLAAHFNHLEEHADESILSIPPSWRASGPGTLTSPDYNLNTKYLPYDYFRSSIIDPEIKYSVAVLPMNDKGARRNSGLIASLHYARELFNQTDFKVIEPGLVREQLLRFRAIMPFGPSLAIADLITSDESLGIDLVLSGQVFDYQNSSANPKVDFSVHVIEKNTRKVVFGARTFSTGLDGVFFFNFGRVFTAHNLLREMSKVTVQLLARPYTRFEAPEGPIIAQNTMKQEVRKKLSPKSTDPDRPVTARGLAVASFFENR